MKLLLDTHIWLWAHLDPDKLSRRVAAALTSMKNELWLSPIARIVAQLRAPRCKKPCSIER